MNFENLINIWKQAAEDLQIKIQFPFVLITDDNRSIRFELFVESFGSSLGTIVLTTEDMTEFNTPKNHVPSQNHVFENSKH